jgi:hypothetical protein
MKMRWIVDQRLGGMISVKQGPFCFAWGGYESARAAANAFLSKQPKRGARRGNKNNQEPRQ